MKCSKCHTQINLSKAKTTGQRFRALRLQWNIGLRELARDVNISPTTLGNIERDIKNTSLDKIVALADYFNVSLDFIVRGKEE